MKTNIQTPDERRAELISEARAFMLSCSDYEDMEDFDVDELKTLNHIINTLATFTLQALDRQRAEIADKMETIRNSGGHKSLCTSTGHSLLCQIDTYIETLRTGGGE